MYDEGDLEDAHKKEMVTQFKGHLKKLLEESKSYFPDNDSQQAGYRFAIEELLEYLESA